MITRESESVRKAKKSHKQERRQKNPGGEQKKGAAK